MKPSKKSPEIEKAIKDLTGIDRIESITNNKCSWCQKAIHPETKFKDALSQKEFTISGFCQKCQDKTFG